MIQLTENYRKNRAGDIVEAGLGIRMADFYAGFIVHPQLMNVCTVAEKGGPTDGLDYRSIICHTLPEGRSFSEVIRSLLALRTDEDTSGIKFPKWMDEGDTKSEVLYVVQPQVQAIGKMALEEDENRIPMFMRVKIIPVDASMKA